MKHLRLSKYNPIYRNELGHYLKKEWIDFSCIGDSYDGIVLTYAEYERVESLYLQVMCYSFEKSGVAELRIRRLETYPDDPPYGEKIDDILKRRVIRTLPELELVGRAILRRHFWAELVSPDKGVLTISFGYDYYMFIESSNREFLEDVRQNLPDGIYVG